MRREGQLLTLLSALAFAAGCLLLAGDEQSSASTHRTWLHGRASGKRPRSPKWVLVKYWVGDAPQAEGTGVETLAISPLDADEENAVGPRSPKSEFPIRATSGSQPEEAHSSILIREGDSGFLAIARGESGGGFGGDESSGDDDAFVDRGFEISPRALRDGRVSVTLAPVFVGGRRAELRVNGLAFGLPVEPGATVMLSAAPKTENMTVRALFADVSPEADSDSSVRRPASLWFQVKIVR